jgi:hypothetical protein
MGYIYWIASYPKSGNTWIRSFLHNLVTYPEPASINDLQAFAPDEANAVAYDRFLTISGPERTLGDYAAVRPQVQAAIAALAPSFVFVKTHHRLGIHLGTPTINMAVTAGAIYAVRNPLDVVVSYSEFLQTGIDVAISTMQEPGFMFAGSTNGPYQACGSWNEHVGSWTVRPHDRIHVVRYEDMLEAPFEAFSGIARFLHANASDDQIAAAISGSSFSELQAEEDRVGFRERPNITRKFFRAGQKDQWKTQLSPDQVRRVLQANGPLMQRFGYFDEAAEFLERS